MCLAPRLPQPELLPGTLFVGVDEALLQRHTNNLYLAGVIVVAHAFLKGYQHPGRALRHHLGRDTGDGIALVNTGWDTQLASGVKGRKAGIAAGTNDHIGPEFPKDLLAGPDCL